MLFTASPKILTIIFQSGNPKIAVYRLKVNSQRQVNNTTARIVRTKRVLKRSAWSEFAKARPEPGDIGEITPKPANTEIGFV